jgi:transposase
VKPTSDTVEVGEVIAELRHLRDRSGDDAMFEVVEKILGRLTRHITFIEQRVAELTRTLYGRKSEKFDPNQLQLTLQKLRDEQAQEAQQDRLEHPDAPIEPKPPAPPPRDKNRNHRGRRPLPAHIPRRKHRLAPTAEQWASLGPSPTFVGIETSEVLDWIPGGFVVDRYEREKWSGKSGDVSIVTAPAPVKLVEKGLVGPGLGAHVVVSKVRELLPLARQSRSFRERDGVDLHRNTLVDVFAAVCDWLEPVADLIWAKAMASYVVQVDDTRLPVQDRQRVGTCKTGHLWVIVGDQTWVAFEYTADWTKESTANLLGSRIGYLQGDGYGGYDQFDRADSKIFLVGCWMHARRGFVAALELNDLRAAIPVDLIAKLYEIEAQAKVAQATPEQRLDRRQRDSLPVLDDLREWLDANAPAVEPKSPLGKAITYIINQWGRLTVPFFDGRLELDNGAAERELKPPAIGRRNWFFAGSDEGGNRAAIANTVIATAVRQGVAPWLYVKDILEKLMNGWPNSRIEELLPCRWAQLHLEAAQADLARAQTYAAPGPAPP